MHLCFNVVSGKAGVGEAVLVRALEPLQGLELMHRRRASTVVRDLCSGPGKLTQALGLERDQDGTTRMRGELLLLPPSPGWCENAMQVGPRVGISKAVDLPLRFLVRDSPWRSRG